MLWVMRETRDVGSKARHLDSEMLISTFAGSLISGMETEHPDRMWFPLGNAHTLMEPAFTRLHTSSIIP